MTVQEMAEQNFFGEELSDLLLRSGREWRRDDALLPEELLSIQGPRGMCFQNSAEVALGREDLRYVEGYAYGAVPVPLPHAWLVTEEGLVVDPTWPSGTEYFGLALGREELQECLLLHRQWGFLQSLWCSPELQAFFRKRACTTSF